MEKQYGVQHQDRITKTWGNVANISTRANGWQRVEFSTKKNAQAYIDMQKTAFGNLPNAQYRIIEKPEVIVKSNFK